MITMTNLSCETNKANDLQTARVGSFGMND